MNKQKIILFFLVMFSLNPLDAFVGHPVTINKAFIRAAQQRNEQIINKIFRDHAWYLTVDTACRCFSIALNQGYSYPFDGFLDDGNARELREVVRVNTFFMDRAWIKDGSVDIVEKSEKIRGMLTFRTIYLCYMMAVKERNDSLISLLVDNYSINKIFLNAIRLRHVLVIRSYAIQSKF